MQTKKQSLIESLTNTAIGFVISYASTFLILPLVGVQTSAGTNLVITIYFTVISILRGYVIRRWFNKKKPTVKQYFTVVRTLETTLHKLQIELRMWSKQTGDKEKVMEQIAKEIDEHQKVLQLLAAPMPQIARLYCHECEIEMPVAEKDGDAYCTNCGLVHV